MSFFVRAHFTATTDEFETLARELAARAAGEPGTLTYRWFRAADEYVVLEEYADEAAAAAHNEGAADLLARVPSCATMVRAEVHGDIGPTVRSWVENNPRVTHFPDMPAVGR
jgi:quinol monooxygenase YgiN